MQRLRQLRYDCDGDAIVALVEPAGPACHTGERSCFYRDLDGAAGAVDGPRAGEPAPALRGAGRARADAGRAQARPARGLLHGRAPRRPERIGDKVREEADEVARAARGECDERLAEEAADVLYHLEVLMLSRDVPLAAAMERLNARRG